eukprot:8919680-Pyramimonas_sp.AAC.1
MDAPRLLEAATRIRQCAGAIVRDAVVRASPSSLASRAMVSRSLARAVWRSDVRLARVLLHQHPWTQSL